MTPLYLSTLSASELDALHDGDVGKFMRLYCERNECSQLAAAAAWDEFTWQLRMQQQREDLSQ